MTVIKIILGIIAYVAAFAAMIFLYAKISRLFKKKSHHYIVPPEPENDKNWHPINFSKYECFIFIKNSSEEFIIEKLKNAFSDEEKETELNASDIELSKSDNWILLKVKNWFFVDFKSMVWWLDDYSEEFKSPDSVIGFCKHKSLPLQDYIFKIDKVLQEENFIGSFRNGKNFGIYLPNSGLTDKGNISLSRNNEVNFYSEESKLLMQLMDEKTITFDKVIEYYRQHDLYPIGR